MADCSSTLYDAFTRQIFGDSQAAIPCDTSSPDRATRTRIAGEIGIPATASGDADIRGLLGEHFRRVAAEAWHG